MSLENLLPNEKYFFIIKDSAIKYIETDLPGCDKEVKELVRVLNKDEGIATINSCAGHPDDSHSNHFYVNLVCTKEGFDYLSNFFNLFTKKAQYNYNTYLKKLDEINRRVKEECLNSFEMGEMLSTLPECYRHVSQLRLSFFNGYFIHNNARMSVKKIGISSKRFNNHKTKKAFYKILHDTLNEWDG